MIARVSACEQPTCRNSRLVQWEVVGASAYVDLPHSEASALEVLEPTRGERTALVNRLLGRRRSPNVEVEVADNPDVRVDIGHVHLKVADLDRSLAFWRDVLGFEEQARMGDQAAFISAGGYHHHIGLNTWESLGGSPPPPGRTGLYHVAVRLPDRESLAETVHRVLRANIQLEGASASANGHVSGGSVARLDQLRQYWHKRARVQAPRVASCGEGRIGIDWKEE